jgi:deoxyribodipyrimidine photo-lyase
MSKTPCTLVWLRRDLRLSDHAALARALEFKDPVQLGFVFDTTILNALPGWSKDSMIVDRRVAFIHAAVSQIHGRLAASGKALIVGYGDPVECIPELAKALGAVRVVFARDDEPAALARDTRVAEKLSELGIESVAVKDQCIFERSEVLTGAGKPFSVFTPYKNAWLKKLSATDTAEKDTGAGQPVPGKSVQKKLADRMLDASDLPKALRNEIPGLAFMGFAAGNLFEMKIPLGESGARTLFEEFKPRIAQYKLARDYPGVKGPSYLSVHLRFGTISIRELVRFALAVQSQNPEGAEGAGTWLSELIWRDFYMQILHHHPHVVSRSFRPEYDRIQWHEGDEADAWLQAWCEGRTGYPIVDAGMRQLNATGYMHNRLRMVVASFLTKDLGIHWRRGEAYFAWKLNDFDLSANNGGWQWAASTGCDAQPYFRIFNPVSQSERFDEKGSFIRRYVPEIAALPDKFIHAPWTAPPMVLQQAGVVLGSTYPAPIVDHDQARQKTLMRFSILRHREGAR